MKKWIYIGLATIFLPLAVLAATPSFTSFQVGSGPVNGYVLQTNGVNSTWVATSSLGIRGGSTSPWATTTSQVPGDSIVYPIDPTHAIVTIGANATSSSFALAYFDSDVLEAVFPYGIFDTHHVLAFDTPDRAIVDANNLSALTFQDATAVKLNQYNCSGFGNGGKLTVVDGTGLINCADDIGATAVGPLNTLQASDGAGGFIATGTPNITTDYFTAASSEATSTFPNASSTNLFVNHVINTQNDSDFIDITSPGQGNIQDNIGITPTKLVSVLLSTTTLGGLYGEVGSINYGRTLDQNRLQNDDVSGWVFYGLDDDSAGIPAPQRIMTLSGYGNVDISQHLTLGGNLGVGNIDSTLLNFGSNGHAIIDTDMSIGTHGLATGGNTLDVRGPSLLAGNVLVGTSTSNVRLGVGTTTPGTILSLGSSTQAINFDVYATSTMSKGLNLKSGCYAINNTCLTSSVSSPYPFPLAGNATSSLTQFNGGITAFASSTIGSGTQTTGLTVSGGATTTGNAYIAGKVGVGTTSPWAQLSVSTLSQQSGLLPVFAVGSTTSSAPPILTVLGNGFVGIGSSSPTLPLAVQINSSAGGFVPIMNFTNSSLGFGLQISSRNNGAGDRRVSLVPVGGACGASAVGWEFIQNGAVVVANCDASSFLQLVGGDTTFGAANSFTVQTSLTDIQSNMNVAGTITDSNNGDYLISTNGNPSYFGASGGNVGIGNTSPSVPLEIGSSGVVDGRIRLTESTNGTFGDIYVAGDDGNLVIDPAAGSPSFPNLLVGAGNVAPGSKLSVNGNMGIGSTYAAIAAPTDGLIVEGSTGIGTSAPDSKLDVNGTFRLEGTSAFTTASISGAIVGVGCDTADTTGLTGLASSTVFVTTPRIFPGAGLFFYTMALTSTSARTFVCADVAVTPTASTYNVRIIR